LQRRILWLHALDAFHGDDPSAASSDDRQRGSNEPATRANVSANGTSDKHVGAVQRLHAARVHGRGCHGFAESEPHWRVAVGRGGGRGGGIFGEEGAIKTQKSSGYIRRGNEAVGLQGLHKRRRVASADAGFFGYCHQQTAFLCIKGDCFREGAARSAPTRSKQTRQTRRSKHDLAL